MAGDYPPQSMTFRNWKTECKLGNQILFICLRVNFLLFSHVLGAYASFLWEIEDDDQEDEAPKDHIQVLHFVRGVGAFQSCFEVLERL